MDALDHSLREQDFRLPENDRYTFAVLRRILRGECELLLTDHERFLLCHSAARFPVWIWTPDGAPTEEKERAWQIAREARPLTEGFKYNLKYELAEYFMARAKDAGVNAGVAMNLLAYDCPVLTAPARPADGGMYICTQTDIGEAAQMIAQFHVAIDDGITEKTYCRSKAEEYIGNSAFFLWKNRDGKAVACCAYKPDGDLASLSSVYTLPEYRRRHYAANLVYAVTKRVADLGYTPMLYTDADYGPSNACYTAIGYIPRGRLCTLAAQTN